MLHKSADTSIIYNRESGGKIDHFLHCVPFWGGERCGPQT